jgi:polar amino acid transport system ATP-binding protein
MTVLENLIMAPMNLRNMPRQQAVDLAEALLAKVDRRLHRQRAGDGYPLLLAAGQARGPGVALIA